MCGLLGPNGAGKTTLVSIIAGPARRRRRQGHGRPAVDIAAGRRGLGRPRSSSYPALVTDCNLELVRENLELFAGLAGYRPARRSPHGIDEVADDRSSSTDLLDRQAAFTSRAVRSGGSTRRWRWCTGPRCSCCSTSPPPGSTSPPAPPARGHPPPRREEGCAVVYSTHYLPEVEELGASVAILDRRRILARGAARRAGRRARLGPGRAHLRRPGPGAWRRLTSWSTAILPHRDRPPGPRGGGGSWLGPDAERLVSVDLSRPSLETVFLAITGRAYRSDDEDRGDDGRGDGRGRASVDRAAAGPRRIRAWRATTSGSCGMTQPFLVIFTVMPLAFMAFNTGIGRRPPSLPAGQGFTASIVVPGATVLFSGFLVGNLGFAIFREHGWGTWERLRSSPLSTTELMVGKSDRADPHHSPSSMVLDCCSAGACGPGRCSAFAWPRSLIDVARTVAARLHAGRSTVGSTR